MLTLKKIIICGLLISAFNPLFAKPEIFLFLGGDSAESCWKQLNHPEITGAQIIYSWKRLEPKKDKYNIQPILDDLAFLTKHNKKLFIQIQDRSFSIDNIPVPKYLLTKEYNGGVVQQVDNPGEGKAKGYGWVTQQWNPKVQKRFQKLLNYLGQHLSGKIYGVNLPETAIEVKGFTEKNQVNCQKYLKATMENMAILKKAFSKSFAVQYINFLPGEWNNDQNYMSRLFKFAAKNKIGIGNPDAVPYRKGQMKNSYPFFNKYKNKMAIITIAVQEPDYTYTNTKTGEKFTVEEIYNFATNYIGAQVIFWNIQEPQFTNQLLPFLNNH